MGSILDPKPLTVAAGNATYVRGGQGGFVLDVTAPPYNAKNDESADAYAAINNAASSLETFGGGTVFMPEGAYKLSAYLRPRNYVRYQGVGIGRTILKPYQSAAFTGSGTLANPIQSPEWFDMTWDGSNIPSNNSLKGQFSEYLQNAHWERVECKNFTATGFGSDYLPGGRYINCIASGNGRGQAVGGPGMSGFGIGTGMYDVEDVLVQGNIAFNNTNYGIFFEKQGSDTFAPYHSKGVRVIGNHCYGNTWGIGGCGVDTPVYSDNISRNNTYDGITLHEGSGVSPLGRPDKRAIITGNQCYNNGRDGINLDYGIASIPATDAQHIIDANRCYSNGRDGLRIIAPKWASDVLRGIQVGPANRFDKNVGHGFSLIPAATAEAGVHVDDLSLLGFSSANNGDSGVYIGVNTTRIRIKDIKAYDAQATKTQKYGIYITASSVHTGALIVDNDLLGNSSAPAIWDLTANFAGTGVSSSRVARNRGMNQTTASITVGTSPFTYNCGPTPETVYWAGGSTSSIKITPAGSTQATVLLATGAATVPIEPGDVLEFAYTAGPTSLKTLKRP